jgi:hypothetical protein
VALAMLAAVAAFAALVGPKFLCTTPVDRWWSALAAPAPTLSPPVVRSENSDDQPASRSKQRGVPEPSQTESGRTESGRADPPDPQQVLQLAGDVPQHGEGVFSFAKGRGPLLGTDGPLHRFHVAVERGSGEDVAAFAAQVDETLGDDRSWAGGGELRLQRVPDGEDSEFTIHLATLDTADQMCQQGGLFIKSDGQPYTSCRTDGHVIINLDRWRLSVPNYTKAKTSLAVYRQYVVNHEVGHQLGEQHQDCPRAGGPAPVMMQQTLKLLGCTPFAWPRRDGRLFAGRQVA